MKKRSAEKDNLRQHPSIHRVFDQLFRHIELLPVGLLVPLFHRLHRIDHYLGLPVAKRLGADVGNPRDAAEARNLRLLRLLLPADNLGFAGVLFKPTNFIHRFEEHYSLPGYLDEIVLPYFYRATDELAKDRRSGKAEEFLAFVYMFFLLIHPLPDGNGRVARSLMEYYNKRLELHVKEEDRWYDTLKDQPFHGEAFRAFFCEADLPSLKTLDRSDPYPIPEGLESHLGRMADYLIDWAESVRTQREPLGQRVPVRCMSQGIRALTNV
jgi:hypothetical protein